MDKENKLIERGWSFFYGFVFFIASYQGLKIFQDVESLLLLYMSIITLAISVTILVIGYTKKHTNQ